jgi:hypothetical protein
METELNKINIIYQYGRDEAIEDGILLDATKHIDSLDLQITRFDKIFITITLFEDISNLDTKYAMEAIVDLIEFGLKTDHDIKRIKHFHLPNDKVKIKSSEENGKYILELCYASED